MFAVTHSEHDNMILYIDGAEVASVEKNHDHSVHQTQAPPVVGALRHQDFLLTHHGGLQGVTYIPKVLASDDIAEIFTRSGGLF